MGDAGSNFLGYGLAVLSILGAVKVAAAFSMLIPILILAVPIFDTAFAIIRRLMSGKSPFEADGLHLHHRILHRGLSHKQTTCIIYAISLVLGIVAIISANISSGYIVYLFSVTVLVFVLVLWKLGLIKINIK